MKILSETMQRLFIKLYNPSTPTLFHELRPCVLNFKLYGKQSGDGVIQDLQKTGTLAKYGLLIYFG